MSAINYTFMAETVALAIFFLLRLACKDGVGVLFKTNTYLDLWNNVKPAGKNEKRNAAVEPEAIVNVAPSIKNATAEPFTASLANHIYQTVAPHSKVKIKGFVLSVFFLTWFIGSFCSMFASLFWYFYTTSCVLNTTLVDNRQPAEFYRNLYSSGNSFFCNSKFETSYQDPNDNVFYNSYTLECLLNGMTPADFDSHPLCPVSNIKGTDAFTALPGHSCCAHDITWAASLVCNHQCYVDEEPFNITVWHVNNPDAWFKGLTVSLSLIYDTLQSGHILIHSTLSLCSVACKLSPHSYIRYDIGPRWKAMEVS